MEINRLFAHYNVIHELGRGGMGVVYKAYDTKLKRTIALKMILQTQNTMRFMVETSATAQLNHTNIVRLYEFGEIPQPFFTMEYIEGDTLKSLIKKKK